MNQGFDQHIFQRIVYNRLYIESNDHLYHTQNKFAHCISIIIDLLNFMVLMVSHKKIKQTQFSFRKGLLNQDMKQKRITIQFECRVKGK